MDEVRRTDDDELCGHVDERDGRWLSLTVFGGVIGSHDTEIAATRQVLDTGLASMAERWTLRNGSTGEEEIVCIQEANAAKVTVALGYFTAPGVPIVTITAGQLAAGEWELRR